MKHSSLAFALLAVALSPFGRSHQLAAQRPTDDLRIALQTRLEELHSESGAPGVNVGIVLADGTAFGLAAGLADTALGLPMEPTSRLMQGSVGKTYVSAVAMQLIHEGLLDLDARGVHLLGKRALVHEAAEFWGRYGPAPNDSHQWHNSLRIR